MQSRVHLKKYTFRKIHFTIEIWKLFLRKYMMSHDLPKLCEGPETLTELKSESFIDWPTNQPTDQPEVGVRDAYASKNVNVQ